jgi:hemolysin D
MHFLHQTSRAARQTFAKEAATLLGKAESEIALREEELRKATQKSQLQQLTAPVDGIVQQLSLHTLGAVVKPANPILVIVPSTGALIVDAQILNKDVGQLKTGDPVAIKLEAFPFTRYGTIPGTLTQISRDAVQDEKLGLIYQAKVQMDCGSPAQPSSPRKRGPQAANPSPSAKEYRASFGAQHGGGVDPKSTIDPRSSRAKSRDYLCAHITPGMATTTDIKTDQRRIITFLLSPIQRRLAEAGREE